MRLIPRQHEHSVHRTGMVLVLVLVVVMVLSFAVYSFSSLMMTEYTATTTGLTHLQRRELANSAIEVAAVYVHQQRSPARRGEQAISLQKSIRIDLPSGSQATMSLLRDLPGVSRRPEFGLSDESAKLNVNTLPLELSRRKEARRRLTAIPGLSVQIADAIIDWMDPDDEVFEFGAETSFYTAQSPPRQPRQGPFQNLNELLMVRGVSNELLYGEDQNGNGFLDAEENDGDLNAPRDNKDGILQRGWSDYLTLLSCEGTSLSTGRRKINLNTNILAELFDQLEPVLGTDAAVFIVACRMRGATFLDEPRPDEGEEQERRRLERLESVRQRLEAQLGNVDGDRRSLSSDQTQRGGLVLDDGPSLFKSLTELFGGQVRISLNGQDALLQSPWPADPVTVRRMLPVFEQMLTTSGGDALSGRINVNEASEPVLHSIPGITESVARSILRMQGEIRRTEAGDEFHSVAWLLSRGLVSMSELRSLGPYVTVSGDIRSGIAVGQTNGHASVAAIRFMLDCSSPRRRILTLQDLPVMSHSACGLPKADE